MHHSCCVTISYPAWYHQNSVNRPIKHHINQSSLKVSHPAKFYHSVRYYIYVNFVHGPLSSRHRAAFLHFFYVRWPDSFYPCLTRTIRSLSATYHQKITPLNQNLIQYALIIHDINAHSSNLIVIHHIVYTHIVETSTESSYLRFFKVSVWAPRFFPPLINYIHQISIQSNLRCVYNVHNASRSPRIFAEQNELIAASLHFR